MEREEQLVENEPAFCLGDVVAVAAIGRRRRLFSLV
jgi:hypothetical protein